MKFLILGDTHITNRKPERRKDQDYLGTIMGKLAQVVDIYDRYQCSFIVQVGDFFDSPTVSNEVIARVVSFILERELSIYCIYGQHDIVGHSAHTLFRSPLAVLAAAQCIKLLTEKGTILNNNIVLYGCSYGQEMSIDIDPSRFNILVIHDMIGPEDLYPGQDITKPHSLIDKYPGIDLFCCGDYHYPFVQTFHDPGPSKGIKIVCNPGALMRKTIGERDLELNPGVLICDTEVNPITTEYLDVEEVKNIFDFTSVKGDDNKHLLEFIENLRNNTECSVSWREILDKVIETKKVKKVVVELIDSCIEEICNGK